ncbi:MAG: STAS domain-containing protein [Leptospira sp.]|nr:STAS domain-containing protein [Leptospira sp.]
MMIALEKKQNTYQVNATSLDVFYVPVLEEELERLFQSGENPLFIDFSQVEEVSSAVLGLLLHKRIRFQKAGKDLLLIHVQPQIQKILRILHLEKYLMQMQNV